MTTHENDDVQSYIFRFITACLKNTLAYNKLITMVVKIRLSGKSRKAAQK